MKKILLLIPILLFVVFSSTDSYAQRLIIKFNNGNENPEMLNSIQKLYFSGNNLMVDFYTGADDSYQLDDIRKLYFDSMVDVNDLNAGDNQGILLYPNPAGNHIFIKNIPDKVSFLSVYSMGGQLVMTRVVSSDEEIIDITHLNRGLYLVQMSGCTIKFIKK